MSYTNLEGFTEINNEIILPVVQDGYKMFFDEYDKLKGQCIDLAAYLESLDVNEESEQEIKRIVAKARKLETAITQRRKHIKFAILEPYKNLEEQADELISIIKAGEDVARDKLADIEHDRRGRRMEEISKLWELRKDHWLSGRYLDLADFLEERHLNRTVTINSVEKGMVSFFQSTSQDIKAILAMPEAADVMVEYKKSLSFAGAVNTVNQRKMEKDKIAKPKEPYMVIWISGKANCILAKQLLSDIDYRIVEEN